MVGTAKVNIAVEDRSFASHVRSWFERDLESAERIDDRSWRTRSVARRGAEWVAWALRELF